MNGPRRLAAILLAASALGALASAAHPSEEAAPGASPDLPDTAAVLREARHKMSAAIRPLYVFWIRAGNVGGARILWREGDDGRRGYELLIGSDPRRAPRKINQWGWEREDLGPDGAAAFGLMRKTDDDSLNGAKQGLRTEGDGGFVYKAIRSRVAFGRARAENTLWRVPRDFTYRDPRRHPARIPVRRRANDRQSRHRGSAAG